MRSPDPSRTLFVVACNVFHPSVAAAGWEVGGGYFGETIAHPGVVVVADRPVGSSSIAQPVVTFEVGTFWHPRATVGVLADAQVGLQLGADRGYSFRASAGLGYLHSFIAAETVNFANTGRPGLMPLVDVGAFGWTLQPDAARPARVDASLRLFGQYPVNHHLALHPALVVTLTRAL
jgi:hypothetical protein